MRKFVEVGVFRMGWVTLSANFRQISLTNHCWCQKTRVIAISCGIKISAVHCLFLLQSTRVTDKRTDRWTDPQNYDFQDRASIAASRGKKPLSSVHCAFCRTKIATQRRLTVLTSTVATSAACYCPLFIFAVTYRMYVFAKELRS